MARPVALFELSHRCFKTLIKTFFKSPFSSFWMVFGLFKLGTNHTYFKGFDLHSSVLTSTPAWVSAIVRTCFTCTLTGFVTVSQRWERESSKFTPSLPLFGSFWGREREKRERKKKRKEQTSEGTKERKKLWIVCVVCYCWLLLLLLVNRLAFFFQD